MVHVSNAEGRRKMLAFSTQPELNLNTILVSPNSKEDTESNLATSSEHIINNSTSTVNTSNTLNLSCIIEEDSSLTNNMMTPDITITSSNSNGNADADQNNCNLNNNATISDRDNNSNNPDSFNDSTPEISTNEILRDQDSAFTHTAAETQATNFRKKRSNPDKLNHNGHDESADLEGRDGDSECRGMGLPPILITTSVSRRKSPPTSTSQNSSNHPQNANISKENESVLSTLTTSTSTPSTVTIDPTLATVKNKLSTTSKQVGLKRVSFGSSKGSMVETLVYESPVTEEHEISKTVASTSDSNGVSETNGTEKGADRNDSIDSAAAATGGSTGGSRPPSRVRVTFFESEKPLAVSSPESDNSNFDLSNMTLPGSPSGVDGTPTYNRQMSGEIGWENPFRPDGDLSKEADQIVELIKEGKPINDETLRSKSPSVNEAMNSTPYSNFNTSPPRKGANGSTVNGSGSVEVQRGVAPGTPGGQVEHVVLKKKKGCCVIQ